MTKYLLKIANITNDRIIIDTKYLIESMTYIEIPDNEITNNLWNKINILKDQDKIRYTYITKEYVKSKKGNK